MNLIGTALSEGVEKKVYLAIDQRAKNAEVVAILDQIRLAGITSVVILANQSRAEAIPRISGLLH
jgi:biopolymer transport protein ExbD